jgi:hypothetical protein
MTGLPRLPEPPFRRAVPTTPADRAGAHVDYFPAHAAFPTYPGGSASALSLSRPAQALLALRPAESLSRPKATFVTRLRPFRLPGRAARQLPDQSTTFRMESSSTDGSRLRGARGNPDIEATSPDGRRGGARANERLNHAAVRSGRTSLPPENLGRLTSQANPIRSISQITHQVRSNCHHRNPCRAEYGKA